MVAGGLIPPFSDYGFGISASYMASKEVLISPFSVSIPEAADADFNDIAGLTGITVSNDYVIEVQSGTATGKITLQNVSAVKVSGKKITAKSVSAELPSSSEDYWFMTDETNDELGELLDDATLDNAIGMLESDSAISLGSARIDQITTIAKHQSKK